MEILSGLLSLCEGNPSVTGVFPFQRANYAEIWKLYLIDQKRLLKWLSNCRSFEKPWRSCSVILLFGTYAKLMIVSNETILNFSTTVVMLLQWIGVVNCWFYIWWRHQMETFPRYWPFVKGIHRSPMDYPHKGQWREALVFSLICTWTNGKANIRDAGDLRRYRSHYDATIMQGCSYNAYLVPRKIQHHFSVTMNKLHQITMLTL